MKLNFTGFENILSNFYTDSFDIYTKESFKKPDGTIGSRTSLEPLKTNIQCRISYVTEDSPSNFTEEANNTRIRFKVFCDKSIPIRKGDKITLYKNDGNGNQLKSYTGYANLPIVYETHQELLIDKVGEA